MKKIICFKSLLLLLSSLFLVPVYAQDMLGKFDFFYAGQSKQKRMFIVKSGTVVWEYFNSEGKGEISDAILLNDGNVLFAHQYGITEINSRKEVLWSMEAPQGMEIHTVQPIGKDHIVYVQNGKPGKVVVMQISTRKIVREFEVPVNPSSSVHGQFRNARLTPRGTLLLANMCMGVVTEYDSHGKVIQEWKIPAPWSAVELKNGNILVVSNKGYVCELDRNQKEVWNIALKQTPEYHITSPQKAVRLANGNTIVNNWFNEWNKVEVDRKNPPLQAVELTPEGKVVSQLCAWNAPDLGPSTTIQLLSEVVDRNKCFFGDINR